MTRFKIELFHSEDLQGGGMNGSENKAHEKGELSVTLGDPTAKAQLLSQLHCSRKDSLP